MSNTSIIPGGSPNKMKRINPWQTIFPDPLHQFFSLAICIVVSKLPYNITIIYLISPYLCIEVSPIINGIPFFVVLITLSASFLNTFSST